MLLSVAQTIKQNLYNGNILQSYYLKISPELTQIPFFVMLAIRFKY